MPEPWWWIPVACAVVAVLVCLMWRPCQAATREARLAQARKEFHRQREWLEAKFISLAPSRGESDSPRWSNCEFDDAVSYVRQRSTGELSAFVAVTVALEGIGPGGTSATAFMSSIQAGTAVFRFDNGRWATDGRLIHNLSPDEAIRYYQGDLEMVGQELADRAV